MHQSNSLQLAKQGNPEAIAALINQSLKLQGIIAKVNRKNDCLGILMEGSQLSDQDKLVSFVQKGIEKLELPDITTLKIIGRQSGENVQVWRRIIILKSTPFVQPQEQHENLKAQPDELKIKPKKGSALDIVILSTAWLIGMALGIFLSRLFGENAPRLLRVSLGIFGLLAPSMAVLVLRHNRHWKKARFGIITVLTAVIVVRCAFFKEPMAPVATSSVPTVSQTQSESQQGKWYEGGSLHNANGLEWQTAYPGNKLATCADFVSTMWQKNEFKEPIQSQIQSMDDMKILSQELMNQMDIAMKETTDPIENRQIYTNQKASDIAALLRISMGWLK